MHHEIVQNEKKVHMTSLSASGHVWRTDYGRRDIQNVIDQKLMTETVSYTNREHKTNSYFRLDNTYRTAFQENFKCQGKEAGVNSIVNTNNEQHVSCRLYQLF